MRYLITLIIFLIMVIGCKTKRSTTTTIYKYDTIKESLIVHDTIIIKESRSVRPPTISELDLNPCDSLGKVKPIYIKIKDGSNTLIVKDTLGKIAIKSYCEGSIDSIKKIYESRMSAQKNEQKSFYEKKISEKKVTTIWSKWTYIFLIAFIVTLIILLSRFRVVFPKLF